MDINEIRRINLQTLANQSGGVGKLAEKLGKDQSQVSQWIVGSINSATGKRRGMRADTCREIEKVMNKPRNWLDQDHHIDESNGDDEAYIQLAYLEVESAAGDGMIAPEFQPTLRKLEVLEEWAYQNFGTNAIEKIRIITNKGDSMSPTIQDGDILFVDITAKTFEAEGIYVINFNDVLLTKRLVVQQDGRLAIVSDNREAYEPIYISSKNAHDLKICGRVRAWWSLRKY
ncbi:helix-turn-helix transcriptional regulator [Oligella urethralis]|uniref:LexA family transcriptional regulator n=1 Tax=Oligella urethralis TaxID=90245 RepID=UPI000CFE8420|nr:LexA family transcriptional regulator [Oligella urethralis]AVL70846.1 helix-turn-helix transcriptional regulator [Oligella urethralis]